VTDTNFRYKPFNAKHYRLYFKIVIIGLFMWAVSCGNQKANPDTISITKDFWSKGNFSTLTLSAQFSECGEWGGNQEKLTIYSHDDFDFYLNYQTFTANCDSVGMSGYPFRILSSEKSTILSEAQKDAITQYVFRLLTSKFNENWGDHAGHVYSASLSDSTLNIHVYDVKKYNDESYKLLLDELQLN